MLSRWAAGWFNSVVHQTRMRLRSTAAMVDLLEGFPISISGLSQIGAPAQSGRPEFSWPHGSVFTQFCVCPNQVLTWIYHRWTLILAQKHVTTDGNGRPQEQEMMFLFISIRMSCLWFPAEENNNRLANPEIMLNLYSSHKHFYWTQEAAAAENDAD